jgi:hypothetical protein
MYFFDGILPADSLHQLILGVIAAPTPDVFASFRGSATIGYDLQVNFFVIPEPGALGIFVLGLLFAARRRRRG